MFWTIVATLSVLWAVGVISAQTLGGFIHLLLVMALQADGRSVEGDPILVVDGYGNAIHQTGATPNTRLFAGEQQDSTTKLYYDRARWYNPSTGDFITTDPAQADANHIAAGLVAEGPATPGGTVRPWPTIW